MPEARNAFHFERDFSRSGAGLPVLDSGAPLPVPHARHRQLLEEARQDAYAQGLAQGREVQRAEEESRIAGATCAIADALRQAGEQWRVTEADARREALAFAFVFARKLAGRLVDRMPVAAIEATARAILNDLRGAPHLAVRVAPPLVDQTKARLAALLAENGIDLKLFVFPDPTVSSGDCRIEWAEGGILRERAKLEILIEQSLDLVLRRPAP